ncbi:hypothetical protein AC1031_015633 [Aphanomyces cochlioides]|nr:hypothetical protein AC1031_015633 [Aphanomyces cochlioides]
MVKMENCNWNWIVEGTLDDETDSKKASRTVKVYMDGDRESLHEAGTSPPAPIESIPATTSEDAETARQMLEKRFKLHKKLRQETKAKHDAIKAKASRKKDSRVDHKNMPHKWKDAAVLENELKARECTKVLMSPEHIRPFPGHVYSTEPMRNADEIQAIQECAASAAKREKASNADVEEYLKLDQSKLPLHLFDSSEYDTSTPDEMLHQCHTGASPYFVKGEWRWRACEIQSYNHATEKYTIQFVGSDKEKTVRRINLRFDHEDAALFQRRIDEAIRRREDAKAQMRFDHFVAQQSVLEPRAMSRSTLEGIHRRVVDGLTADVVVEETHAALLRSLTDVVIRDYTQSMKKAVLWYRLQFDQPLLEKYTSLNLAPVPPRPSPPVFGKMAIPHHAFAKHVKAIAAKHFTASDGFLNVLRKIYHGWETTFLHLTFCATSFDALPLPCRLIEFSEIQTAHCIKITDMLSTVSFPCASPLTAM